MVGLTGGKRGNSFDRRVAKSDGRDENVVDAEVGDSIVATLQLQNRH